MALFNDFADPIFDGVGLAGPRAGKMIFYCFISAHSFLSSTVYFPISSFFLLIGIEGLGSLD